MNFVSCYEIVLSEVDNLMKKKTKQTTTKKKTNKSVNISQNTHADVLFEAFQSFSRNRFDCVDS